MQFNSHDPRANVPNFKVGQDGLNDKHEEVKENPAVKANELKQSGNNCMSKGYHDEAIDFYTKAMEYS